jgi:hypothetical protein
MAWHPYENSEPIEGYTLVKKLGTGGYGEVWKATAPGGLTKAIKIIYGNLTESRAEQEYRALARIKEVRYPFLLSLERIETIEDTLLIVTELADESLLDRFDAYRKTGKPGIPREELLPYLRDCADALDYMNDKYGLQHLDIKPQNLLLVGGRIKIADFGLVKDLEGTSVTATGGVTPIYAPPEAFDNKVSRYSDQYSLAIVYQEMLTGIRPFPGKTYLQLLNQHVHSPPMLDPLPTGDRPIVGRALAKIAEYRFPTCREMVDQLMQVKVASLAATPPANTPMPTCVQIDALTVGALGTRAQADAKVLAEDTIASARQSPLRMHLASSDRAGVPEEVPAVAAIHHTLPIRPTLFLGIGGLAGMAIRHLRKRLFARFGEWERLPIFGTLLVDTDRATLRTAIQGKPGEALAPAETLLMPLYRPDHYRPHSKKLLRWLDRRWLYGIPRSQLTEGMRPLGRLALVDHAGELLGQLRSILTRITSAEARAAAATVITPTEAPPRILLVASISGGTGSGMLIDVIHAVQQVLEESGQSSEGMCLILLHATAPKPAENQLARINAYATLAELHHVGTAHTEYPGDPDSGLMPARHEEMPLPETYIVHLGDHLDQAAADVATDAVGEYLFQNSAGAGADFYDQYRQSTKTASYADSGTPCARSFGMYRLHFPRHALAELASGLFCRHLIARWRSGDARVPEAAIKADALRRAAELGLQSELLADRFHAAARRIWGDEAENHFAALLSDWPPHKTPVKQAAPSPEAVSASLQRIEEDLGAGGELAYGQQRERTLLESAIAAEAACLGPSLSSVVLEWLIEIVDDPRGRLKAALGAASYLLQNLTAAAQSSRYLINQYRLNRDQFRERLLAGDFETGKGGSWLGVGRRPNHQLSARHFLLETCRLRYKELIVEGTLEVLRGVSSQLEKFSQEAMLAREKLDHFSEQIHSPDASAVTPIDARRDRVSARLLPWRSKTLVEAATAAFKRYEPEMTLPFEDRFKADVLSKHGGLWALVSRTANLAEVLQADLQSRARAAMLEALAPIDAAQLFLEAHANRTDAREVIASYIDQAAPPLVSDSGWQHLVIAAPVGPAGNQLVELIANQVKGKLYTVQPSDGDVVLCLEGASYPLARIAQWLAAGDPAVVELAAKVSSRVDVHWTAMLTNR